MTKEEFIKKVNEKYGVGRYTVVGEYKNNKSKILIRCNVCGHEWETNSGNFINVCKVGCPKCSVKKTHDEAKLTTEEIIKRGKELYGDRYSYSKTDSLNRDNKGRVCFTCNVCGEVFWERPSLFLKPERRLRDNCPNCIKKRVAEKRLEDEKKRNHYYTTHVTDRESFIRKLEEKYPGFYDTSLVEYINCTTNVILIHNGKKVITTPMSLFSNKKPITHNRITDTESFVEKARIIHNNKYEYFHTEYVNSHENVIITCHKHGDFLQTPNNHLNGAGCPYCRNSRLENELRNKLSELGVQFLQNYHTGWLGRQHLDFYLPEHNVGIECQGEQHFTDVVIYDSKANNIERDYEKYKKCKENGLTILYYFPKSTKIKSVLTEEFKNIYSYNNSFNNIDKLFKKIV
jgi:hypothetical protein